MRNFLKLLLCNFFLLIHLSAMAGESIVIAHQETLRPNISILLSPIEIKKLNKEGFDNAKNMLAIYLVNNGIAAQIPVAGKYHIEKNKLIYTPLYELGYNLEFEVRCEHTTKQGLISKRFHTPSNPASAFKAKVETMYPLTDTIPYNALYFHVRFSQPMFDDINAFKSVKVFNDEGKEITNAWRHKSFWIDGGKLLVLMIHPGRVKNGIHYESPLFDSGKYYTIQIKNNITDRNGNPNIIEFSRKYFVGGEDREIPKVQLVDAQIIKANSNDAVDFIFSEGMDNASVLDGVKVLDESSQIVPCSIHEKKSDKVFTIIPEKKWKKGHYSITLNGSIYDFAGNRINRLFEITDINQINADKKITVLKFDVE